MMGDQRPFVGLDLDRPARADDLTALMLYTVCSTAVPQGGRLGELAVDGRVGAHLGAGRAGVLGAAGRGAHRATGTTRGCVRASRPADGQSQPNALAKAWC